MKARRILMAVCVGLLAALIAFPVAQADRDDDDDDRGDLTCIEGTWSIRGPDGRIFRETLLLGRDGQTIHFALNSRLPGDATLGGLFPDATFESTGPARGSGVRIGRDAFEFEIISWAVNVVDGVRSEVAYIAINAGVVVFPDCDTQEVVIGASYFLPEQDADGDGIPDEGEEPFLAFSDLPAGGTKFFPRGESGHGDDDD